MTLQAERQSTAGHDAGSGDRTKPSFDRIPVLDGLRSLVVLVLVVHYTDSVEFSRVGQIAFDTIQVIAGVGLDVFFALSGFLITGILLDTKDGPHYFRNFYVRRILRIFPLYYGFLIAFFLILPSVSPLKFPDIRITPVQQLYYWGYLINVAKSFGWPVAPDTGHFWSLAVEEQFYLLWPAVVYFCSRRQLRTVCIGCLLLSPPLRIVLSYAIPQNAAFHQLMRFDVLALGGLAAILARTPNGVAPMRRWVAPAAALGCMLVIIAVALKSSLAARALFSSASPYLATLVLLQTLLAAHTTRWFRLVGSWPLRRIGLYSYAIYVLHDPLADVIARYGWLDMPRQGWLAAASYCAKMIPIAVAAGALSWHLYERPFTRMKDAFAYRRPVGRVPARLAIPGATTDA